jgi:N-methylhydantoinase B
MTPPATSTPSTVDPSGRRAAHLGERRLSRLFSEFGADVVEAAVETILDAAEAQTRAVVSTWKDGVFLGEAFLPPLE